MTINRKPLAIMPGASLNLKGVTTMKTYQHFATVLARLLGTDTAVRLTVNGYMPLPAHVVGEDLAYIHVKSIYPLFAPLPIAKNGFYAHYIVPSIVAAAGGPVNYIDVMLAAEGAAE